jgi:NAD(P)H-dependent FMN reductase
MSPSILVFAGSARRESLNKKLARAAALAIERTGGQATFVNLNDYEMPVYHGDLEAASGLRPAALRLRDLFLAHQGLAIASPENNASVSALTKNTIDWLSRGTGDGQGANSGLAPFAGKVAALMAASPGAYGGMRALPHLRQILGTLNVTVLSEQVAVGRAHEAFEADGALKAPHLSAVERVMARLVDVTRRLAPLITLRRRTAPA